MPTIRKTTVEKVKKQGGTTLREDLLEVEYDNGYIVAIASIAEIPITTLTTSTIAHCRSLCHTTLMGIWISDDVVFYDEVIHVTSLTQAIFLGEQHNQTALWDCKNKTEVVL